MRNILQMERPWEERRVSWKEPNGAYSLEEVRTQWDYCLEGYFLAHCLGTKDADEFNKAHRVFSLRDRLGVPHCTVLLQRDKTWSPYGGSSDLGTNAPCTLSDSKDYFVLQVRGREDDIARWEYYYIVMQWYLAHGGQLKYSAAQIRTAIISRQDDDLKYHYGYMLDEGKNYFDWAHHHGVNRDLYRKYGLSL